jgi:rRNA processing protein Gar1
MSETSSDDVSDVEVDNISVISDNNPEEVGHVSDLHYIAAYVAPLPDPLSDSISSTQAPTALSDASAISNEPINDISHRVSGTKEVVDGGKSDTSSFSSDDESSLDDEPIIAHRKAGNNIINDDLEDEDEDGVPVGPLKTRNEVEDNEVMDEPLTIIIEDHDELLLAGQVTSCILDNQTIVILIQAKSAAPILQEGSLLCLDKKSVLGKVQEVFGPITAPFYLIRCKLIALVKLLFSESSNAETNSKMTEISKKITGCEVYSVKRLSEILAAETLMQMKLKSAGSDASNAYDEEVSSMPSVLSSARLMFGTGCLCR